MYSQNLQCQFPLNLFSPTGAVEDTRPFDKLVLSNISG